MNSQELTLSWILSECPHLSPSELPSTEKRVQGQLQDILLKSEEELERLVEQHKGDMFSLARTTGQLLSQISAIKERIMGFRCRLLQCKSTLSEGLPKLRELSTQLKEEQAVYELFTRVQSVASLPEQVEQHREKKRFIQAVKCCLEGLHQLQEGGEDTFEPLNQIAALGQVHERLLTQRKGLTEKLTGELFSQLYSMPSEENLSLKVIPTNLKGSPCSNGNFEDYDEMDAPRALAQLVECMSLLEHLPMEAIKGRFDSQLPTVALATVQYVLEHATQMKPVMVPEEASQFVLPSLLCLSTSQVSPCQKLSKFIDLFLRRCNSIIWLHESMVNQLLGSGTFGEALEEMTSLSTELWCKVHSFVTLLLDVILENEPNDDQEGTISPDYSSYFAKRSVLDRVQALGCMFTSSNSDDKSESACDFSFDCTLEDSAVPEPTLPSLFTFQFPAMPDDTESHLQQALQSLCEPSIDNLPAIYEYLAHYARQGINPGSSILKTYLQEAIHRFEDLHKVSLE